MAAVSAGLPTSAAPVITVTLTFTTGTDVKTLAVQPSSSLRAVQPLLCRAFRMSFPATMAAVTVRGQLRDDFADRPFQALLPGEGVAVSFSPTDDPFWFDLQDRCGVNISIEEEVAYDAACAAAVADGAAAPPLAEWVHCRRFGSLSLAPVPALLIG